MKADVRWKQCFFNSRQALAQLDASFQPATVNQREQERPIQLDVSKPNDKPQKTANCVQIPDPRLACPCLPKGQHFPGS